jgi:hypothetical protein
MSAVFILLAAVEATSLFALVRLVFARKAPSRTSREIKDVERVQK